MTIIGDKEAVEKYAYYLDEKAWRRNVLDSIEPNMTEERAKELKISIKIKLIEEEYQITMDGVPVGDPYPMPAGMIDKLMWGPNKPK